MNRKENEETKSEEESDEGTEGFCISEFTGKGNYQEPTKLNDPIKYNPTPNQFNPEISLHNQKENVIPPIENDKNITYANRSTNFAPYFKQYKGSCYAHAATSAYINTCARIFGAKVPTYDECIDIADYIKEREEI